MGNACSGAGARARRAPPAAAPHLGAVDYTAAPAAPPSPPAAPPLDAADGRTALARAGAGPAASAFEAAALAPPPLPPADAPPHADEPPPPPPHDADLSMVLTVLAGGDDAEDRVSTVVSDCRTAEELAGELASGLGELRRALSAFSGGAGSPRGSRDGSRRGRASLDLPTGTWDPAGDTTAGVDGDGEGGHDAPAAGLGNLGGTGFGAAFAAAAGAATSADAGAGAGAGDAAATSGTPLAAAAARGSIVGVVRLYNDLAVRLMENGEFFEAHDALLKAETLLDQTAAGAPWAAGGSGMESAPSGGSGGGGGGGGAGGTPRASLGGGGAAADAQKLTRLRVVTLNNLGCLCKRRGAPEEALAHLERALALEARAGGGFPASTHLNVSAALSALGRHADALAHAERAVLLLQRQLWGAAPGFEAGVAALARALAHPHAEAAGGAAPPPEAPERAAARAALHEGAALLAMAYHNAGAENEHLGRLWEAQVSLERARALGARFLGSRSPTFNALNRSYRHFLARHPPAARPPAPAPRAHAHAHAHAARGGKGGKDAKRRGAAARPGSGARVK